MVVRLPTRLVPTVAASLVLTACASAPLDAVASRVQYRVPFDVGQTQETADGRIEITEIWGTRPQIEVGGDYLVIGRYSLKTLDEARICFYLTANNWDNSGPDMDLQHMTVKKGHGAFALMRPMQGPGYFHVSMSGKRGDEYVRVANVYFGTGDTLLRGNEGSGRAP